MFDTVETIQKVQLVDGKFTPSEASDVIVGLIEKKINFHKIHRLSICEGNDKSDTSYDNSRITELYNELENTKEIIKQARLEGYQLKVNGILELEFVK